MNGKKLTCFVAVTLLVESLAVPSLSLASSTTGGRQTPLHERAAQANGVTVGGRPSSTDSTSIQANGAAVDRPSSTDSTSPQANGAAVDRPSSTDSTSPQANGDAVDRPSSTDSTNTQASGVDVDKPSSASSKTDQAKEREDRLKKAAQLRERMKDTDGDGLTDYDEKNGYYIKDKKPYSWTEEAAAQGYTKLMSNPERSHSVGDPYTDLEKASASIDKGIKKEARHPLVAASPAVGVRMENLVVNKVEDRSREEGQSASKSNSNSATHSTEWNIGGSATVGANISLFDIGVSASVTVSGGYSDTSSSTATVESSSSKSSTAHTGYNTGEAAELNANVRYYNTGTAPIYNVEPTTNFVLDGQTIATVKAKYNQLGDVLKPGGTYPDKQHDPLALNTLDDFGSRLIPISSVQLEKIERCVPLRLQTTEATGLYGLFDRKGTLYTDQSNQWEPIKAQIEELTAGLILNTGNEVLERRVAARDGSDPEDKTPELSIGEAIQIAFSTTKKEGKLYYKEMSLEEEMVSLTMDQATADEIKSQLDRLSGDSKKVYNVKLRQGMKITITNSQSNSGKMSSRAVDSTSKIIIILDTGLETVKKTVKLEDELTFEKAMQANFGTQSREGITYYKGTPINEEHISIEFETKSGSTRHFPYSSKLSTNNTSLIEGGTIKVKSLVSPVLTDINGFPVLLGEEYYMINQEGGLSDLVQFAKISGNKLGIFKMPQDTSGDLVVREKYTEYSSRLVLSFLTDFRGYSLEQKNKAAEYANEEYNIFKNSYYLFNYSSQLSGIPVEYKSWIPQCIADGTFRFKNHATGALLLSKNSNDKWRLIRKSE